ncbi:MAG: type II toxin-antitoxin system VapC family toxin [Solirubrobacterales bacterium]|nr:type II toxin-antitoxin system VapC family toxin [Solirubrobacterales bacterium]MCB8914661.1 type II toxin-antitoxin system VapC family toxin [Thermoleophilales bacterium]
MLVFDASALVKRYQLEEYSEWIDEIMSRDSHWVGSAILATETAIALGRSNPANAGLAAKDARLTRDLTYFDLVAVDADCLARAIDLGRGCGLRTLDAIHLAAASSLPGKFQFVTFDDRQREAARDLGLKVLTPPV